MSIFSLTLNSTREAAKNSEAFLKVFSLLFWVDNSQFNHISFAFALTYFGAGTFFSFLISLHAYYSSSFAITSVWFVLGGPRGSADSGQHRLPPGDLFGIMMMKMIMMAIMH